jgi:hypothetical protein
LYSIIFPNVHAPTEDKTDDMKDSFYEKLEHVFYKYPKYHIELVVGDFIAEVVRKVILKPKTGNKILHDFYNNNGVKSSKHFRIKKSNCQEYSVPTSQHS